MPSDLVRFSVAMPAQLLNEFDAYTSQRGLLVNRSEAIRDLIRDALVNGELEDPTADIVGSITIVYDHHASDIPYKIEDVQHCYPEQIISSMHIHLDHGNCMQLIAVKGVGYKVKELADCLFGIKGIAHGELSIASTSARLGA